MDLISHAELSQILVDFLDQFGYQDTEHLSPHDLRAIYDFTLPFLPGEEKIVLALSEYVHSTFSFLPLDIRKAIAVYDSFQMSIDDVPEEEYNSLDGLCVRLSERKQIQHPVWTGLFSFFPMLLRFYGPYAQTTIFRGAVEFIQATYVEKTLFKGFPDSKYPGYIRRMSAQGPVQAAICFPESEFPQDRYLPMIVSLEAELEYYVGTVNDFFSFYKESSTLFDRTNFPLNEAYCSGRSCSDILRDLVEISLDCRARVRRVLASFDDNKLSGRVEQFFTGYVRYHLACSRYRMGSLCAESQNARLRGFYQMSLQAVGRPLDSGFGISGDFTGDASNEGSTPSPCSEKGPDSHPGEKERIGVVSRIRGLWRGLNCIRF